LTPTERLFYDFCIVNGILCERLSPEPNSATADFRIQINGRPLYVEIKEIEEDKGLTKYPTGWSYSGTPGEIIRRRIMSARKQIKSAAKESDPAILLIYNGVTAPQNMSPTSNYDFIHGMYGEMELKIGLESRAVTGPLIGKNRTLRSDANTAFSAVGRLEKTAEGAKVHLFENMYAQNKMDFDALPKCITWNRVAYENSFF
jgi:hypothetical protein